MLFILHTRLIIFNAANDVGNAVYFFYIQAFLVSFFNVVNNPVPLTPVPLTPLTP